jgi:hypothetical protein
MVWTQATQRLELKDGRDSPCGVSAIGTYQLHFEDGKLHLTCVEDRCAERQEALTGWGPFHPSETYAHVAGRYVGESMPDHELLLTGCGTQRLRVLPDEGQGLVREGVYTVTGSQLVFADRRGEACCEEASGVYAFVVQGDTLKLEAVDDGCQARREMIAACSTWNRVGNP